MSASKFRCSFSPSVKLGPVCIDAECSVFLSANCAVTAGDVYVDPVSLQGGREESTESQNATM